MTELDSSLNGKLLRPLIINILGLLVSLLVTFIFASTVPQQYQNNDEQGELTNIEERAYSSLDELIANENRIAQERFARGSKFLKERRQDLSFFEMVSEYTSHALGMLFGLWFVLGFFVFKKIGLIISLAMFLGLFCIGAIVFHALFALCMSVVLGVSLSHVRERFSRKSERLL